MTWVVVAAGAAAAAGHGPDKVLRTSGCRGPVLAAAVAAAAAAAITDAVGRATGGAGNANSDRADDDNRERLPGPMAIVAAAAATAALRTRRGPRRPVRRTAAGQRDRRRRPGLPAAASARVRPAERRLHGCPVQLSGVFFSNHFFRLYVTFHPSGDTTGIIT